MYFDDTVDHSDLDAPTSDAAELGDPAAAAGPGRLTSAQRRARILEAARAEFARVGFQGASTSRIAELAGCSEPMVYKHFAGKRDLFVSALRDSITTFQASFDSALDPTRSSDVRAQALAFVDDQVEDLHFRQLMRLRMLAVSISEDDDVRLTLTTLDVATQARIASFVERGIEQGAFAPDTDPQQVAWTWLGLMLAACYREALEPGTFATTAPYLRRFVASLAP